MDDSITRNNEIIFKRIDDSIAKNNQIIFARIDDSIAKNNEIIFKRIDDSIARSESFLLDEIDRFYTLTKDRLDRLEKKVDEITVYYQSQRSHDDACETLFHLYYQQQEEIDQIKERLALTS